MPVHLIDKGSVIEIRFDVSENDVTTSDQFREGLRKAILSYLESQRGDGHVYSYTVMAAPNSPASA